MACGASRDQGTGEAEHRRTVRENIISCGTIQRLVPGDEGFRRWKLGSFGDFHIPAGAIPGILAACNTLLLNKLYIIARSQVKRESKLKQQPLQLSMLHIGNKYILFCARSQAFF